MAQQRSWVIYVLKDRRNGDVRYVGVTRNLQQRLADHTSFRKSNATVSRLKAWLIEHGSTPVAEAIDFTDKSDEWSDLERYWIAEYFLRGADLVNTTDGGKNAKRPYRARPERRR